MPKVGAMQGRTLSHVKYCENPGSSGGWVWCQGGLGAKSGGTNALVMSTKLKCLLRVHYVPEFMQGAKHAHRRKTKTRPKSKHWHFSPVR